MAARKNSLVNNINRRKKAGTSRSKSRSTVSGESYENMQKGWPKKKAKKSAPKHATKHRKATKKRTAGHSRTASKSRSHAPKRRS
jgi:hypothetical protein